MISTLLVVCWLRDEPDGKTQLTARRASIAHRNGKDRLTVVVTLDPRGNVPGSAPLHTRDPSVAMRVGRNGAGSDVWQYLAIR